MNNSGELQRVKQLLTNGLWGNLSKLKDRLQKLK